VAAVKRPSVVPLLVALLVAIPLATSEIGGSGGMVCERSAIATALDPEPEWDANPGHFPDPGAACNDEARFRTTAAVVVLVIGILVFLGLAVAPRRTRRNQPDWLDERNEPDRRAGLSP
jgi:hypothetical protein